MKGATMKRIAAAATMAVALWAVPAAAEVVYQPWCGEQYVQSIANGTVSVYVDRDQWGVSDTSNGWHGTDRHWLAVWADGRPVVRGWVSGYVFEYGEWVHPRRVHRLMVRVWSPVEGWDTAFFTTRGCA